MPMTPMKCLILNGLDLFVEDGAGIIEHVATGTSEAQAGWLAGSLAEYHRVPLEYDVKLDKKVRA